MIQLRCSAHPASFLQTHTQLPNGEINAEQLRYAASVIRKYGEDGCADITTRANLQLRGVKLEDADGIIEGLIEHNMGSFQSGMDSVRNLTGSPIAGLDPHELFDTRWAAQLGLCWVSRMQQITWHVLCTMCVQCDRQCTAELVLQ
jgi:sulfite reductase beta subunit-like hemoprotein